MFQLCYVVRKQYIDPLHCSLFFVNSHSHFAHTFKHSQQENTAYAEQFSMKHHFEEINVWGLN